MTAKFPESHEKSLRLCPHGFHHPQPDNVDKYPHGCDGCWCDDERDRRRGWPILKEQP